MRKRTFKRKRSFKRRGSSKRFKRSNGSFKKRVKAIVQSQAEHKFLDISSTQAAIENAAPLFIYLVGTAGTSPALGTGRSDRIGSKIRLRSLKLNGFIQPQSTAGTANEVFYFRMIIGIWNDAQFASPTVSLILDEPTNQTNSFLNRDTIKQKMWVPLLDKRWIMVPPRNVAGAPAASVPGSTGAMARKLISINLHGKRLPRKDLEFAGVTSTDCRYFVMLMSNLDNGANGPQIIYSSRMTYTDV